MQRRRLRLAGLALVASILWISGRAAAQSWRPEVLQRIQNGSVLATSERGEVLFAYEADKPLVPASTLKVATALAALKLLGEDFRFKTVFFLDKQNTLYVKGYGDPFLVSEEIRRIAAKLKSRGLRQVNSLVLDISYFGSEAQVPGLAASLNPYDAYNGALVANFNTVYVVKSPQGEIRSAEPQTPLTEITRTLASRAPVGKSRINVATHEREASVYFGHLLKAFLMQEGIPVQDSISLGRAPEGAKPFLSYESSKDLTQVLKPALEYSQNLIMNQLFFAMGAEKYGAPASLTKGKKTLEDFLRREVGLKHFRCEEGSGISRENLITASEMDRVLAQFFPYRELLPQKGGMWVKTGTLKGVSTLVGYFPSQRYGWVRFVILLNQGANHREAIAASLYKNLQ